MRQTRRREAAGREQTPSSSGAPPPLSFPQGPCGTRCRGNGLGMSSPRRPSCQVGAPKIRTSPAFLPARYRYQSPKSLPAAPCLAKGGSLPSPCVPLPHAPSPPARSHGDAGDLSLTFRHRHRLPLWLLFSPTISPGCPAPLPAVRPPRPRTAPAAGACGGPHSPPPPPPPPPLSP